MENNERKISTVEAIFMLLVAISADLVESFSDVFAAVLQPVPVIGQVLGFSLATAAWSYGLAITLITLLWAFFKGLNMKWLWGGSGLELIPILNALPFRTAAMIAIIAEDRVPQFKKAAELAKPATAKPAV